MKYMKLVSLTAIAFSMNNVFAASTFDDLKPRLQKIAECNISEFPKTKSQKKDLDLFGKQLSKSGVKIKTVGGGGPEETNTYNLPSPISLFGVPVSRLDNYQAPFIEIGFAISAKELAKTISAATGFSFKPEPDVAGGYVYTNPAKIKVEGKKYPLQQRISIFPNSEKANISIYVCNFQDTDPNADL